MIPFRRLARPPLFALLVVACNRQPEPENRASPPPPAADKASQGSVPEALLAPGNPHEGTNPHAGSPHTETPPSAPDRPLTWKDPPGWTRMPSSSAMRLATYKVPREKGDPDDSELTVFHFGGGMGGSVDANFDRWVSQFHGLEKSQAVRTERTVAGLSAHVLRVESGAYFSAMAPGASPNTPEKAAYGLVGAIVDTPGGPYFFKLIGPKKTVSAQEKAFFTLLESLQLPG